MSSSAVPAEFDKNGRLTLKSRVTYCTVPANLMTCSSVRLEVQLGGWYSITADRSACHNSTLHLGDLADVTSSFWSSGHSYVRAIYRKGY